MAAGACQAASLDDWVRTLWDKQEPGLGMVSWARIVG